MPVSAAEEHVAHSKYVTVPVAASRNLKVTSPGHVTGVVGTEWGCPVPWYPSYPLEESGSGGSADVRSSPYIENVHGPEYV